MPTLTINKTYANGQVLTEQDLDSIKDSIETFLNVTKIDDDNIQDNGISASKLKTSARLLLVPTGTVLDYAGSSIPGGYLECLNQEVAQATYPDLFTAIGTTWDTWNGAASPSEGNFRLPPGTVFRIGSGTSPFSTVRTLGDSDGVETFTLTNTQLPAHTHTFTNGSHTHSVSGTTASDGAHQHAVPTRDKNAAESSPNIIARTLGAATETIPNAVSSAGAHTHTFSTTTGSATGSGTTDSTGSGTAFNIMNPLAVFKTIIKT